MKIKAIGCIIVCLLLGGCTLSNENDTFPADKIEQILEEVVKDLQNNRLDDIEDLFSEKIKSNYDIKEKILSVKNFINGEIESYDSPKFQGRSRTHYEKGLKLECYEASVDNITTDSNHHYFVQIEAYVGEHDEIWIDYFFIMDDDAFDVINNSISENESAVLKFGGEL